MAVGFASYASAAEVKKDTKAPVLAGKTMTDTDMDKITAGSVGVGVGTASGETQNVINALPAISGTALQASGINVGFGVATAGH